MTKQVSDFQFDLKESFPLLERAPIVEAVIHWSAKAGHNLDREQLRQQLTTRLPDFPSCHPDHELHFRAEVHADGSSTHVRHDTWRGFRLTSTDGRYIAQFRRDGLALSRLAPYENWNSFVAVAKSMWSVFIELAKPTEIRRLGIRFINRIPAASVTAAARKLKHPPRCLEPLQLSLNQFLFQSTYDVPGYPYRVRVVQTIQPPALPARQEFGLLLDVDVGTTRPMEPTDSEGDLHLDRMRWLKNKAFFHLLSPQAVRSFGAKSK